jgi:hypothetical protein
MLITKDLVRNQLLAYLNHRITLAELVDWAENALLDGELEAQNAESLRDIIARLGLADVRQFGLSWTDCSDFLRTLGYQVQVDVVPLAT